VFLEATRKADKTFDMSRDALLGFFNVFLPTRNFEPAFLLNSFLFLSAFFLLLVCIIENINLDAQLVTKLAEANALDANNTTNILLIDVKFDSLDGHRVCQQIIVR